MKLTEEQKTAYKRQVQIAYHTKAFQQSFDLYWQLTGALRIDAPTPYPKFWEDQKAFKLAAWEKELEDDGEGQ